MTLEPGASVVAAHGHKYRPDIDGLRAIAVGIVVLFHAFPQWFPGGFIGVDVFFVISGYLITTILLEDFAADRYSISRFYSRRIRRIFPALLAVLVPVLSFGWVSLYADEYKQLALHAAGGIGFISNFLLWNETGYFDSASHSKPLLHLWSLSIEEQFYILWPLILWVFWRIARARRTLFVCGISFLMIASFVTSLVYLDRDSAGGFYFPFPRAWELLSGGALAYFDLTWRLSRKPTRMTASFSFLAALAGLVLLSFATFHLEKTSGFPGYWALLPVVGATMLIGSRHTFFHRTILSNRVMVGLGLISYPLYLWHWPIFSFIRIEFGSRDIDQWVMPTAIAISVVLAWLTYRFLETPVRTNKTKAATITIGLVGAAISIAAAALAVNLNEGLPGRARHAGAQEYLKSLEWAFTSNPICERVYGTKPVSPFCFANSTDPEIFLLGDSHANQLVPGLAARFPIISAGNGAPLDGVKIGVERVFHEWTQNLDSWELSKRFLSSRRERVKIVIIAAQWEALATGHFHSKVQSDELGRITLEPMRKEEHDASRAELLESSIRRTVDFIESLGSRVIIVLDPPEIAFHPKDCKRSFFGFLSGCSETMSREEVLARQAPIRDIMMRVLKSRPTIVVADPIELFCDQEKCRYFDGNGLPFYRDPNHLSAYGSDYVGSKMENLIHELLERR